MTRGFGLPIAEQSTTSFGYDDVGNVTGVTDPLGNPTATTYDAMRRPLQVTLPIANQVVKYTYDADGRVTKTERGNPTSGPWEVRQASYTPTGQVSVVTNPDGSTVTTAYDLNDRVSQVTQQVTSNSADDRVTQLTYDGVGRVLTLVDATSNTSEQHSYTANGQKAWFKDARGYQTSYTYDDLDRLYRTTYPDTSFEQFAYDAAGNVTAKTWRDGQAITNTYDALNRLTQMSHAASGRVVTYAYDAASRITSASDNSAAITAVALPPGVPGVAYTTTYSYDELNRPTAIGWDNVTAQAAGASAAVTFDHWYNKARQRTYQTATDNSWWSYPAAVASTVSYSTNNVNQYTAVGSTSPTYTGKGSLSSDGTFTYGYDGWNRLSSASGAGNSATYTYDATGRRKSKTVNGTTTVYVNSGDQEVLEYDGSTGQILAWYAYGAGIDEALNRIQPSGDRVTLIPDIQGSVIGSLDSATATLAKTAYLPFGESANTSGSYRYTGRRIDAETNGLYYYRARTYSPVLGRFIQPDPIGYAGGANLYAYVGNDPLNLVDPSGLFMERTAYNASVAWQVMKDNPGDVALGAGLVVGGIALGALSTGATPFTGGLSLGGNFAAGGAISGGTVLIGAAITAAEVTVAGTAIASGIIMMNQAANGGGGDVTRRPSSFRKGTVNESWNNAPDGPNGGKLCPTCGAEVHGQPGVAPRRGNWDIDHNPKWGERNLEGLDRKGVLDNYNSDTRLRCVPCNRADN